MTRRVDREKFILGTGLEEPTLVAWGGERVENMTHGLLWRLQEILHAWRLGPKTAPKVALFFTSTYTEIYRWPAVQS
jgi:hypothetical protein